MQRLAIISVFIAVSTLTIILHCGENPVDPELNPQNADAQLFLENENLAFAKEGDVRKIGVSISYPVHLAKVTISSTCGIYDTVIIPDSSKRFDTLYIMPVFTVSGKCTFTATATYKNSAFKEKQHVRNFFVDQGDPGVAFVTIPKSIATQTGKVDTLILASKTTGSAMAQEYAVSSVPVLDQTQLSILPSVSKDTLRILFHTAMADTYTVSAVATALVPGAAPVKATALVGVRVYNAVAPSRTDVPQTIVAGFADTLRFAVDNSTRPDKLTMKLITDKPLDAAIFTILPSSADSILLAVAAGATTAAGTVKIGVSTSNGVITDTSWYPITFVDKESAFWNVAEVAVAAYEGTLLRYDLRPYFVKPQSGSVTFTSDIGAVTADTFWQYTPAYGTATPVKATITAQKGTAALDFTVTVSVTATDSTPPTLTLVDAILNGKKVSSSQITVASNATDNGAGVAKVTYAWNGKTVDAAIQADNTWSGIITGLENGKATDVTVTAIDKSMKKNSASITFTVTYETATSDTTPPVITTQPEPAVSVIEGETLTLTVTINGTSALTYQWYKDDVKLTGQTNATFTKAQVTAADAGSYYVVVAKSNGRDITSNKAVVTIRITAKITEDPVSKEANEGGSVTFTVKAEGEAPLTYQWLRDGTAISGATAASYPLNSVTTADDKKSFRCVVSNSFSKDTSAAAILSVIATPVYKVSFSLDGGTPAVSDQDVKQGGKATTPTGTLTKANFEFGGWYKDAQFTTVFDFTTQTITQTTVIYAKWIPVYTITYYGNGSTGGSVPLSTTSLSNKQIAVSAPGSLTRTGYTFFSWNTDSTGGGIDYQSGDILTMATTNIRLFARWTINVYQITFNVQGGIAIDNKSVKHGDTIPLPITPVNRSYSFDGWFKDVECSDAWDFKIKITGSVNLYAKWVIRDVDGNLYSEVKIGSQVWMVENLKTTKFNDGSSIPRMVGLSSDTGSDPGYSWYNNNVANKGTYGAIYNWYAVNGHLAPAGWHVATDAEWSTLTTYLGGESVAGGKLKEAGTADWNSPNTGATNETGFTALPGGYRDVDSTFHGIGTFVNWWTATKYVGDTSYAWSRSLNYDNAYIKPWFDDSGTGFYVRCIRDY